MRRFLMPVPAPRLVLTSLATFALVLPLAGCYTVNQSRLGNFVSGTIQPGMPLDQALVRMRTEGFYCSTSSGGTVTICSRTQERLLRSACIERVDLVRSAASATTVGTIDIMEIKCPKT